MPPVVEVLDEQIDAAIEYVINEGAVDRAQTVSYSRVFEAAGLPPPQELHFGGDGELVTHVMKRFHDRCHERSLPPLDSLVVHVAGAREGRPGVGYFRVNGLQDPFGERATAEQVMRAWSFWVDEDQQCKAWGVKHRRSGV
jgi:hypothetical protein